MAWEVQFDLAFDAEFDPLPQPVQTAILAKAHLIEEFGPELGRPHVDTLEGSKHPNMKELRCSANNGVWRTAFAFDPERRAILLVAGNKAGVNEKRFYKSLIARADERFNAHLAGHNGGS